MHNRLTPFTGKWMIVTPVQLGQAALATSPSLSTIYTAPAATKARVTQVDVCNTTAVTVSLSLYFVPSGGTAGTGNAVFYSTIIPPNGTIQWTGAQIIEPAGFIQASGSAAGLTLTASGETLV